MQMGEGGNGRGFLGGGVEANGCHCGNSVQRRVGFVQGRGEGVPVGGVGCVVIMCIKSATLVCGSAQVVSVCLVVMMLPTSIRCF